MADVRHQRHNLSFKLTYKAIPSCFVANWSLKSDSVSVSCFLHIGRMLNSCLPTLCNFFPPLLQTAKLNRNPMTVLLYVCPFKSNRYKCHFRLLFIMIVILDYFSNDYFFVIYNFAHLQAFSTDTLPK